MSENAFLISNWFQEPFSLSLLRSLIDSYLSYGSFGAVEFPGCLNSCVIYVSDATDILKCYLRIRFNHTYTYR